VGLATEQAHEPLITMETHKLAQRTVQTRGTNGESGKAPRQTTRPYLFRGLITCGRFR